MEFQIKPEAVAQPAQEDVNKMIQAGENAVNKGYSNFDENGNVKGGTRNLNVEQPSQENNNQQEEENNNSNQESIPDKFKNADGTTNVEALLKSYKELEKSKGTNQEQSPENKDKPNTETKDNKDNNSLKIESVQDAINVAQEKGIDYTKVEQEYVKTGKLSEDTYKMLGEKGIPKEMVNQFLAGQQAQADKIRTDILTSVGGEEKYKEMTTWALNNLSESELDSYNRVMQTNDKGFIELAVNGLKSKYVEANGQPPAKLITGKSPQVDTTSSVQPLNSMQEYANLVNDPRYKTDATFRNNAIARLNHPKTKI